MATSSNATTSNQPKYQGYPYVNLPAFGVPTIDSQAASRYANLPRRPITAARTEAGGSGIQNQQNEQNNQSPTTPAQEKHDFDENPVVYVDLPDGTDNGVVDTINQETVKTPDESISYKSDDEPVLYIDMPDHDASDIYVRSDESTSQDPGRPPQAASSKGEDEHVVYIDIPECSGSGVSERRQELDYGPSTSVVQETILYDQFKDRRIDVIPQTSLDSPTSSTGSSARLFQRPTPPNSLNLRPAGTANSSLPPITPRQTPTISSYLSPNSYRGRTPEDDFRLPPLPVNEFPDPPPAYTEIDFRSPVGELETAPAPVANCVTAQPIQRTRVVLHDVVGNPNRKFMTCKHCGMTVNSLVIKRTTLETHMLACLLFMFAMFPIILMIYCCDYCKTKVHYCPNCGKEMVKENFLNF
nr:unnamed protein product [Amyelois transitella]